MHINETVRTLNRYIAMCEAGNPDFREIAKNVIPFYESAFKDFNSWKESLVSLRTLFTVDATPHQGITQEEFEILNQDYTNKYRVILEETKQSLQQTKEAIIAEQKNEIKKELASPKSRVKITDTILGLVITAVIAAIGGAYALGKDTGSVSSERQINFLSSQVDSLRKDTASLWIQIINRQNELDQKQKLMETYYTALTPNQRDSIFKVPH